MSLTEVFQHAPLALYGALAVSLSIYLSPRPRCLSSSVWLSAGLVSLASIWLYSIRFLTSSYQQIVVENHAASRWTWTSVGALATTAWLRDARLLGTAWRIIAAETAEWWISSQLCTFTTGMWTIFLYAEASRQPAVIPYAWMYMLLNHVVGSAPASGLFLAFLSLSGSRQGRLKSQCKSNNTLESAVAIGMACTLFIPKTFDGTTPKLTFATSTVLLHAIAFAPLMPPLLQNERPTPVSEAEQILAQLKDRRKSLTHVYASSALFALLIHTRNTLAVLKSLPAGDDWTSHLRSFGEAIFRASQLHPVKQAVFTDLAWTNGIWQLWAWCDIWFGTGRDHPRLLYEKLGCSLVVATVPSLSSAVGIGAYLAFREVWLERDSRLPIKAAKHE